MILILSEQFLNFNIHLDCFSSREVHRHLLNLIRCPAYYLFTYVLIFRQFFFQITYSPKQNSSPVLREAPNSLSRPSFCERCSKSYGLFFICCGGMDQPKYLKGVPTWQRICYSERLFCRIFDKPVLSSHKK